MANDDTTRTVGHVDSYGEVSVSTAEFRSEWSDGTRVERVSIEKVNDAWMLRIRGKRRWRGCRMILTPLDVSPDGSLRLSSAEDAATDTCSGNFCSSCEFHYKGLQPECKCNHWWGWCNHTTTSLKTLPDVLTLLEA
jgi:hypothetical protein